MRQEPFVLGAVAYDPKVVTIWEGFRDWFAAQGFAFDYVLYSNYERRSRPTSPGSIDVAWNSPLAWVRPGGWPPRPGAAARAVAMRDTDQDLTSRRARPRRQRRRRRRRAAPGRTVALARSTRRRRR